MEHHNEQNRSCELEADSFEMETLVNSETQKNTKKIKCLRCDSIILQENSCIYTKVEQPIQLPSMKSKKEFAATDNNADETCQVQTDKLNRFWCVNEMLTFENVGFTNSVKNLKYLICADCEIGPIGLQDLDNPDVFLVSLERVKHV